MLAEFQDLHVWTQLGDAPFEPTFRSNVERNANATAVRSQLPDVRSFGDLGFVGHTPDGIVVVVLNSLPNDESHLEILREMEQRRDASGFVVDLRNNRGGSEHVASEIAAFFNDTDDRVYARTLVRDGAPGGGMVERTPRRLRGIGNRAFRKPVACLVGPGCVSSGEGFALMMKAMDHVELIGQPTRGASGNPKPVRLTNGVRVWIPTWVSLELDGSPIEGRGVLPDIEVDHLGDGDPTFAHALKHLRQRIKDED